MKLLKEDFGESEELNTFVSQIERRFGTYYQVTLKVGSQESRKYFAYDSAARKYYESLKSEAENNKEYYDGSQIELTKITVSRDEEELDFTFIDAFDDEDSVQ